MKRYAVVAFMAVCLSIPLDAKDVKQFQKEISSNANSLKEIHRSLNAKKAEMERAALDEKAVRAEIKRIGRELDRLQADGEKIRRQIIKAERDLREAQRRYQDATGVKEQWHSSLSDELDFWYRAHITQATISPDLVGDELRLQAIKQKRLLFANARSKEQMIAQYMKRLQQAQRNLVELKSRQEQTLAQQLKAKELKQNILKTATGRRIGAEEEIARLTESAKALENLINDLIAQKKKSEEELAAAKAEKAAKKRKATPVIRSARHHIPWPVAGKVVSTFGKSKHPDLDTIVVSNGIKIDAAPGAEIKAVDKGEVIFAGEFRAYGKMIIIDHHGDFYTIYGQLTTIAAEEGAHVRQGDPIGSLGSQDHVLYFEVRTGTRSEDPMPWLNQ